MLLTDLKIYYMIKTQKRILGGCYKWEENAEKQVEQNKKKPAIKNKTNKNTTSLSRNSPYFTLIPLSFSFQSIF